MGYYQVLDPFGSPNESFALKIKGARRSLLAAKHSHIVTKIEKELFKMES
jgi:hypothetical protein